jgi:hypothetical protein
MIKRNLDQVNGVDIISKNGLTRKTYNGHSTDSNEIVLNGLRNNLEDILEWLCFRAISSKNNKFKFKLLSEMIDSYIIRSKKYAIQV